MGNWLRRWWYLRLNNSGKEVSLLFIGLRTRGVRDGVYGEGVCTLYNQTLISVPSLLEVLVLLPGTAWNCLDSRYTRTEFAFLCICLFSDKSMNLTFGNWLAFSRKDYKITESRLWKAVLSCPHFLILNIKTWEAKDMAVPGTWNSTCVSHASCKVLVWRELVERANKCSN